jgi:hypothetical protein
MFLPIVRKLCPIAAIAVAAAACASEASGPVDFSADTGPAAVGEVARPRVVAQVMTEERAQITFYNERSVADDPVISMEIVSPGLTPALDAVLSQRPSALELFVAMQPTQRAPDELVREHKLLARVDAAYRAEPRALVAASASGGEKSSFACVGNYAGWLAAFHAWAPPLDGQYAAIDIGATSGYVGYAPKFYFDVCRVTASSFGYVVKTEQRINATQPWLPVYDGSPLGLNQRYRFYRNTFTCANFQYRLYVEPFGGSYFRGATWADEWSCAITQ